jgi:hypothetical protein
VPHQKARRGAGSVIMPSTLPLRTDSSSHACERADLATRKLLVSRTWMRDHPDVDSSGIQAAFDDVFDQAIVFHGFADYMRDYEVFIYATADPRTGIRPEHLRYRFTHCVRATVTSALSREIWRRSLDERLVDYEPGRDLDGYVWAVKWQVLYPGMKLVPDSTDARRWSDELGLPFHEAVIETNGHNVSLVFSDLTVQTVDPGYAPFVVPDGGADFKIPK